MGFTVARFIVPVDLQQWTFRPIGEWIVRDAIPPDESRIVRAAAMMMLYHSRPTYETDRFWFGRGSR
jgi:hypothetical protein